MGSTSWLGRAFLLAALASFGCAQASTGGNGRHDLGIGVGGGGETGDDMAVVAVDLAIAGGDLTPPTPDLTGQAICYPPRDGELCPEAIFVSPTGDDTKDGQSPGTAVQHINMGITRSLACAFIPCVILVSAGTYNEQVTLHENLNILGGYSADFLHNDPVANVVNITSTEPKTVIASALAVPTKLDGVTITGGSLTTNDGASSIGLFVSNTHSALTVSRSILIGGTGATGTPGAPGAALSCGTVGASGGTAFDCGGSTGGFGTSAGDATSGGAAGTGGSSNCPDACPLVGSDGISDGSDGTPGGSGSDGTGGAAPTDVFGTFDPTGLWSGSIGTGGTRGFNGTGGGGGGSGGTKRIRSCFGCGTLIGGRGGDGAPGGCGGGPGAAGGAGGGAFAALLVDSEIAFDNVTVQGGTGGLGGAGGDGAGGQAGSTAVDNGITGSASSKCGLINYHSGNGGHGGVGGNGGNGGGGGGGAGGPSVALVRVGSSAVTELDTVTVMPGAAGIGGAGGKGPGPKGADGPLGGVDTDRAF
ncbi:MAG TPA: hypothetical protein VIA18_19940 [Polyangia bacterium]|nr:hypothetical protein [Polyangia bacterium]